MSHIHIFRATGEQFTTYLHEALKFQLQTEERRGVTRNALVTIILLKSNYQTMHTDCSHHTNCNRIIFQKAS
jgi:hypothetical protein